MNKTYDVTQISDLKKVSQELASQFSKKQLVLLSGSMAAGKTTFVQSLVEVLGGSNSSSPTFSIHQTYPTPKGEVDHIDLYRLKNDHDLETTGFWDLFDKDRGLIFVEWADRLTGSWWPASWKVIKIHLEVSGDKRTLSVS